MRPDPDLVVILTFITTMVVVVPIVLAVVRRLTRSAPKQAAIPSDVAERLERLEQIAEATQLEVERMAEGQRFTTKLLMERAPERLPERMAERVPERMAERGQERVPDQGTERPR